MYAGNAYSTYPHGAYSGYSSVSTANISYETNSKDPVLLRARVFVGNINPKVGRDEIIQLFHKYGTLLGVTVFKGYAFVQFSHGSEADLAVSTLNGFNWLNSVLDVKLAVTGQQHVPHPNSQPAAHPKSAAHPPATGANAAKAMGKRNQNQFFPTPPASTNTTNAANTTNVNANKEKEQNQKRAKFEQMQQQQQSGGGGQPAQQKVEHGNGNNKNESNKNYAAHLNHNELANIHQNDNLDTLICGGCRFVTADLAEFVEHRKHPCKLPTKPDGEPDALICTNCGTEQFATSWALLSHIQTAHQSQLYKEVFFPSKSGGENGTNNNGNGDENDGNDEGTLKIESADVSMEQQFLEMK